jgi:hypothetical protein
MSSGKASGRFRVTDDTFDTIAPDVAVRPEHILAVNATKTRESADNTRKAHRRRLKTLINWLMCNYPDYFEVGTRILSTEERNDPMKFYHTCDRDLVYEGLRVDMIIAYMAANKQKTGSDKLFSYTHIRKIYDAVLFGARTSKQVLSSKFYSEMEVFLRSFKKESADARSRGMVDEKAADPISFTLYRFILQWAMESGNVLVWVWTILQWNLMARSISIDPLGLHNFSISEDHFVVRHDSTKSDKEGEKLHNKGVYCNPLDPLLCPGLSLGVWLCLEEKAFEDNSERMFLRRGGKLGTASHRYCDQLLALLKKHRSVVQTFVQNVSAHGIRKGSATHVASATTCPPPIASIANRGDWSLGKVLDVYWQFAESGDAYLGRCLAGLDPNLSSFSVLPPHWTVPSPLDDEDISSGIECMFGSIARRHPSSLGLLSRVLASVAYSVEWIKEVTVTNRSHPFLAIPILQKPDLLARLKGKVTLEASVLCRKQLVFHT